MDRPDKIFLSFLGFVLLAAVIGWTCGFINSDDDEWIPTDGNCFVHDHTYRSWSFEDHRELVTYCKKG
jgi:hypothetical protein